MRKWGPITVVEWMDSCSLKGGTWNDTEHVEELSPHQVRSVGWLLKEDRDVIVLVPHAAQHQVSGELCILKGTIVRRWKLADPTKRKNPR